ncbi:MAG: threonine synthase [Parasphingopyxis sp.]|nr:threonine synthase [Sphingomonadales bacterium]
MRYVSSRGEAPTLDFEGVTLAGLASDGGLYVPETWPRWRAEEWRALGGLSYAETADRVIAPFVGDALSESELGSLCEAAYGRFAHSAVTPLIQLDHRHWLLELFHGPTLAFKDLALQLLGPLFDHFLARRGRRLTVIGATSGDTGPAAVEALAGRENVEIFMLHPAGRTSDVQRRQMTTILAPNVHNIAVEGDFDTAQRIVKRLFGDSDFAGRFDLGAVNSINWARIAAQTVYYAWAALRLGAPERSVAFSVPTGNFGDVFAGYIAQRMGLPIARLVVATNRNDILRRALDRGDYSVGELVPTAAPSMDIQVSSNFERLLFDMADRDAAALRGMMERFERDGRLTIDEAMRARIGESFTAMRVGPDAMTMAMRRAAEDAGQLLDPHSAIGFAAACAVAGDLPAEIPIVTLATAHPAKFRDAVERATGRRPRLPRRLSGLFEREERYETLPAEVEAVRDYIAGRATPKP